MSIIEVIKSKAKEQNKKIILPETEDLRILKAANQIIKENISDLILIGNRESILKTSKEENLAYIENADFIDSKNNKDQEKYIELYYELRKHKKMTREKAAEVIKDPLYLGCLMIKNNEADGQVAGALNATGDVIRPALQIIKTKPNLKIVSSCFMMILKDKHFGQDGIMFFADCALNITPNEQELAEIAVSTAGSAKSIAGIRPIIAMLCFSTKGSAVHDKVDKIRNATKLAQKMAPDIPIDGELQADAAIIENVARKKAPDSEVAGKANILIFPDLNAGNIGYKLTQRFAGAEAIGPILQGIAKPVNDLSRGCSVDDIVNSVAITVNQATEND